MGVAAILHLFYCTNLGAHHTGVLTTLGCCKEMVGKEILFIVVAGIVFSWLAQAEEQLSWREAGDPRALCNDFSRAGFFLRKSATSSKWIIFLESGSLCYSNDTCNRRFFNESVSSDFCR